MEGRKTGVRGLGSFVMQIKALRSNIDAYRDKNAMSVIQRTTNEVGHVALLAGERVVLSNSCYGNTDFPIHDVLDCAESACSRSVSDRIRQQR